MSKVINSNDTNVWSDLVSGEDAPTTFFFDAKKAWKVHIELDADKAEKEEAELYEKNYILYIDGEKKLSPNRHIEFAEDENAQLKDIEYRIRGTKGVKDFYVRKWVRKE